MKINGSLVFDASSASVIQNLRVERYAGASVPQHTSADVGRMIYVTTGSSPYTTNTLYFGGASGWVAIATGGNAADLQNEVDRIETALGAGVGTDGSFNADAFADVTGVLVDPTSFTNAINQLATAVNSNNELSELDDVTINAAASGDFLRYDGSKWVDSTISLSTDLGITASAEELNILDGATLSTAELNILDGATVSAAELNILDGATLSTAELNFVDGVTSSIQTQLDKKQPLDATLTALAALDSTAGFVVQTGADTFARRELVAPAAGITITNPAGTAGNATFALANDLAALEGLATTGIIVRTGDGTATTRTITGTTGNIVVTDGAGVGGEPTIDLAAVTQGTTGSFVKVTLDGYGRVTGNTAVTTSDITTLVDATYVNLSGDTMTGNLVMGTNYVTMTNMPTGPTHAANKAYVDATVTGLSWKQAVRAATTGNIDLAAPGAAIDGVTLANGDRVLVKSQTAGAENGIYVFNGDASAMTRAVDMNVAGEFAGATVYVTEGTVNKDSGWTQTAEVVTVGTTPVAWYQFSGSSTYIWGDGLDSSGNTVFVKMGAGIAMLPSDEVGLDIETGKAVQLTSDLTGGKLTFKLDTGSGLEQSSSGLKISDAGVTNAMLANSGFTSTADSGSETLSLGNTLHIDGDSVKGLSFAVSKTGSTVTYAGTIADASDSQKGVARYSSTYFNTSEVIDIGQGPVTTPGVISLKANSITQTEIDGAYLWQATTNVAEEFAFVSPGASVAPIALGQNLNFHSAGTHTRTEVLVAMEAVSNNLRIGIREATASLKGVASFNSSHFSVNAGAVSLSASIDDLTNVSDADGATTDSILVKTSGDWKPASPATVGGTINLGDLKDVGTAAPTTSGQALIADGTAWQAKKVYHLHTQASASNSWTVTHSIGARYCNVTVVDSTHNVVIPQSIVFDSTSQLTVTFNTAIQGYVVVMGIA